jgi:hypothetical protein
MMDSHVEVILDNCRRLGVILAADGDSIVVRSPKPLPDVLRAELRQHKSVLLLALSPRPPEWHAQAIVEIVKREGICLFWSDLFNETVAFVKDEAFKKSVPGGIVTYTNQELTELFSEGKQSPLPSTLKLIHEAKRQGGCIKGNGEDM